MRELWRPGARRAALGGTNGPYSPRPYHLRLSRDRQPDQGTA